MLKHYYRLVYWRRRLAPAIRIPVRRGRGRDLLRTDRVRPFLVFAVIVLIMITLSYGLGLFMAAETGAG
ncbi:hypothetical protein NKH18_39065 [Streptomyces sp. M10(2022)]